MKSKYLIVLSFDAVDAQDFNIMRTLPNFKKLIENSSYSSKVQSVYPSLTYPAHATIVTGKYPINHGITNNILIQPKRKSPDWLWHKSNIKCDTLFDIAKNNGYKTAALLWPVTAKGNIDYNLPEIFPNRPWTNQILTSFFNGSKLFQYELNNKFGHLRKGVCQPHLDNFTFTSLLHLIENKNVNAIFVHLTDVDTNRHKYGYSSNEAYEALRRHDERLGKLINLLNKKGIYEDTTLVALGDHSFLDAKYVIKLNKLFINNRLISLNKKGLISKYSAFCNFCDGSAYIYLKDKSLKSQVKSLLEKFSKENNNCIDNIFEHDEIIKLCADPNADFMLEAKLGYYFINDYDGEIIQETKGNHDVATHGYLPTRDNYQTFFIIKDKNIKKNYDIGPIHLVDEGPTIANLLGGNLNNADGIILKDIFK